MRYIRNSDAVEHGIPGKVGYAIRHESGRVSVLDRPTAGDFMVVGIDDDVFLPDGVVPVLDRQLHTCRDGEVVVSDTPGHPDGWGWRPARQTIWHDDLAQCWVVSQDARDGSSAELGRFPTTALAMEFATAHPEFGKIHRV